MEICTYARALQNSVEQRTVISFFALNGPQANDIPAELESMCGSKALALLTVKNRPDAFSKGKPICLASLGPEGS
jgi:hypothetical protein